MDCPPPLCHGPPRRVVHATRTRPRAAIFSHVAGIPAHAKELLQMHNMSIVQHMAKVSKRSKDFLNKLLHRQACLPTSKIFYVLHIAPVLCMPIFFTTARCAAILW